METKQLDLELQVNVSVGDLLAGGKVFGGWCDGDHVFKWLDYNKTKLKDMNFLHIYIGDYVKVVESRRIDNYSEGDIGIVKEIEPNAREEFDVYVKFIVDKPADFIDDNEWFYSKQLEKMTEEEVAEFILINC